MADEVEDLDAARFAKKAENQTEGAMPPTPNGVLAHAAKIAKEEPGIDQVFVIMRQSGEPSRLHIHCNISDTLTALGLLALVQKVS